MKFCGYAVTVQSENYTMLIRHWADSRAGKKSVLRRCKLLGKRSFFMENKAKRARQHILFLSLGVISFVLIINLGLGSFLSTRQHNEPSKTQVVTLSPQKNIASFSYKGQTGKDALSLLQLRAKGVEQNSSGLVVSINGRKADEKKHEYWAFYLNGKMAQVGPEAYEAKNGDTIEWKIEKY